MTQKNKFKPGDRVIAKSGNEVSTVIGYITLKMLFDSLDISIGFDPNISGCNTGMVLLDYGSCHSIAREDALILSASSKLINSKDDKRDS